MVYSKDSQTKKNIKEKKGCIKCKKTRLMKFFEKPTSRVCDDCKRKAKRVKKQSSKSYITKKLDVVWSKDIKIRAGFKCEYCGQSDKALNSHHIFSRSNKAVRHDMDNGICLCVGHHTFSSRFSAHKTPAEFIEWIKNYRGLEWYKRLRAKAKILKKTSY
jgi:hypothetical protein